MNTSADAPRWWVPGDWNGFFGLFTNVVLNVIVLTGLCLHVVNLPPEIVYGRILPALGIALPLGNLYYAYLAWRLAKSEGRNDVTAMPYGPSVPHMFIVVFLIMLPIYLKTHDALLAWQSGLVWCLVIGAIVLLGAFVGPTVRKYTPRAAMLGTLAGISIAFISMRPAFLGWEDPWLFMLSLTIVLVSWMAGIRLPYGLPGGLVAVVLGAPIFVMLGGAALILFWGEDTPIASISLTHYSMVTNPTLATVPLFTLAGYFLAEGGASARLVRRTGRSGRRHHAGRRHGRLVAGGRPDAGVPAPSEAAGQTRSRAGADARARRGDQLRLQQRARVGRRQRTALLR